MNPGKHLSLCKRYWRTKWLRHRWGRDFRHMAELDARLTIIKDGGDCGIYWQGTKLTSTIPFTQLSSHPKSAPAFIVASGPSLRNTDLSDLKSQMTFGVNGSILKFTEQGLSPNYYVISDQSFVREHPELVATILSEKPHCFFTPATINEVCLLDPNLLKSQAITIFENHFKPHGEKILSYRDIIEWSAMDSDIVTHNGKVGFSLAPNKGVFTAHTIVYFALQIAYGLGYRKIGILGMDLTSDGKRLRFYQSNSKRAPSHVTRDYDDAILPSFMVVRSLIRQGVLEVYNLSSNSRLPHTVIPKTTLSDMVSQKTFFNAETNEDHERSKVL